jgi:hypothetical protein
VAKRGALVGLVKTAARETNLVAHAKPSVGDGVVRVERERIVQKPRRNLRVGGHRSHDVRHRAQTEIVGAEVIGVLAPRALDFGFPQARLDDADHLVGDLILEVEHIRDRPVEPVGPQMRARLGLDQLPRDAQAIAGLAHAALQDITHAKVPPDLPDVDRPALVGEARIARDHEQPLDA